MVLHDTLVMAVVFATARLGGEEETVPSLSVPSLSTRNVVVAIEESQFLNLASVHVNVCRDGLVTLVKYQPVQWHKISQRARSLRKCVLDMAHHRCLLMERYALVDASHHGKARIAPSRRAPSRAKVTFALVPSTGTPRSPLMGLALVSASQVSVVSIVMCQSVL
jgi:hypothetical protein